MSAPLDRQTASQPTISMRDFFALPAVRALQDAQKANAYGSQAHRKAHDQLLSLAATYGAAQFIGDY